MMNRKSPSIPLLPVFDRKKGEIALPFGKACLPVGRGGGEGFGEGSFLTDSWIEFRWFPDTKNEHVAK